jgi:hypothetical protein
VARVCVVCRLYIDKKLTLQEAKRALRESAQSVGLKHAVEAADMLRKEGELQGLPEIKN